MFVTAQNTRLFQMLHGLEGLEVQLSKLDGCRAGSDSHRMAPRMQLSLLRKKLSFRNISTCVARLRAFEHHASGGLESTSFT
jgi:hypothetical protein